MAVLTSSRLRRSVALRRPIWIPAPRLHEDKLRGNDTRAAGFALLYPPYNGFQAGLKPASTDVNAGRLSQGEHKVRPYKATMSRVYQRGVQRGGAPRRSFLSPQEWGLRGLTARFSGAGSPGHDRAWPSGDLTGRPPPSMMATNRWQTASFSPFPDCQPY